MSAPARSRCSAGAERSRRAPCGDRACSCRLRMSFVARRPRWRCSPPTAKSAMQRWSASTPRPTSRCFRLPDDAIASAEIGDATHVKAGHLVIAIGRSGQGDVTASYGLVNRVSGPWQTWLGGQVDRLIRLDGGLYDGLVGRAGGRRERHGDRHRDVGACRAATASSCRQRRCRAWSTRCSRKAACRARSSASPRNRCRCPRRRRCGVRLEAGHRVAHHGARAGRAGGEGGAADRRHHRRRWPAGPRTTCMSCAHRWPITSASACACRVRRGGAPAEVTLIVGEWPVAAAFLLSGALSMLRVALVSSSPLVLAGLRAGLEQAGMFELVLASTLIDEARQASVRARRRGRWSTAIAAAAAARRRRRRGACRSSCLPSMPTIARSPIG